MTGRIDDAAFAATLAMVGGDLCVRRRARRRVPVRRGGSRGRHAGGPGRRPGRGPARAAHTLKGSSASLGALDLADACRTVEGRARDGELDGLGPDVDAIAIEFDAVVAGLDARTRSGV